MKNNKFITSLEEYETKRALMYKELKKFVNDTLVVLVKHQKMDKRARAKNNSKSTQSKIAIRRHFIVYVEEYKLALIKNKSLSRINALAKLLDSNTYFYSTVHMDYFDFQNKFVTSLHNIRDNFMKDCVKSIGGENES